MVVISRHATAGLSGAGAAMEQSAPSGLARPPAPGGASVRLLRQAAQACSRMSYQGEEMLGDWGRAGQATSVVEVWHASGGVAMAQAVAAAPGWPGEVPHIVAPASYLDGQALVGSVMLGMSQRLVALLSANYQVAAAGWGQVAGRPARVITARQGHIVSVASFTVLTVGTGAPGAPVATVPRKSVTACPARLRAEGWPLPGP